MSAADASILAGLTDAQRQAVEHTEGPLLVLAAAGSGKTRVITRRVAHLVLGCGVPPWSILALTFTNKAAGEMRERIGVLLEGNERASRGLTVTTFHALCARLIRRYADRVDLGIPGDFTIYPSSDQVALVKRVIQALDMSTSNWSPRSVLSSISDAKNALMDAEAYNAQAGDYFAKQIGNIFTGYERAMREAGAVDFDDLLVLTAKMLRKHADIRRECTDRWRYLMIDEYQDTNHAQFVIASLLAGDVGMAAPEGNDQLGPNICVVGAPDQAIYGWRGADISNILDFEQQYPGAAVIPLGENFRSTAPILAAADTLIRKNQVRKHKDLFTSREGGEQVEAVRCRDERHEARLVADWLAERREESDLAWKDMAIFYRTNALSRVLEGELRDRSVPYIIARGTAFYEREEVRHALAYCRLLANNADDVSLERIVNMPSRGLGKTSLEKVRVWAGDRRVQMFHALSRIGDVPGLTARASKASSAFVALFGAWSGEGTFMGAQVATTLADLVERVVKESGLERHYTDRAAVSKAESDAERVDNLGELISSAAEFEERYDPEADPALEGAGSNTPPMLALLRAWLESVALVADADEVDPEQGAVTLMTLHAAKGLEFPAVAMVGLEEGVLPHSRSHDSEAALEEERRLCFVGITRTMNRLIMTSSRYRTNRGLPERMVPSRFFDEIGSEHLAMSDQADDWADEGFEDERNEWDDPRAGQRSELPIGSLVRHPQFGVGEVLRVQAGKYGRATVRFEDVGVKTLILEYARLTVID